MLARVRGLIPVVAVSAVLLGACDDETAEPVPLGPTGPPSIAVVEPSGAEAGPVCISIGDDPDARIPLLIEAEQLVLRPPEACGAYVQCGHLALYVDQVLNNESAVPSIDVLLRKLGDRYHDGEPHEGTGEADVLHVSIEVQDDLGDVLVDHDGEALVVELDLVTLAGPCSDTPRQPPPEAP
mgnify:CR=1 FL=1